MYTISIPKIPEMLSFSINVQDFKTFKNLKKIQKFDKISKIPEMFMKFHKC
jgi:hypothetical protein